MRSLLECLGFPTRESTYRDLTVWLLGIDGERVAKALAGFDTGPVNPESVKPECALEGAPKAKMRLDLYFECEKAVIGVEMKVHSSAAAGQLDAYAAWLKGQAGPKRAALVFLTETGAVPEYPAHFQERIRPVEFVCATWDRLVGVIPDGDPLGWKDAARKRADEIRQYEDLLCGATAVPRVARMDHRLANVHARGVLALALRVASKTGLKHVMGPTFGAYNPDPQVDLAKPDWTVDLDCPHGGLKRANPLGDDRFRFTIRARFRENAYGELGLGIGSTFVPYPPDVGSAHMRAVYEWAPSVRDRGICLRQRLVNHLGACRGTSRGHGRLRLAPVARPH